MCEGRRHPQMTTRTLGLQDMPPHFKPDGGIFKAVGMSGLPPPTFDLNKNNLAPKDARIEHHATTTSHHPPPFTASWLTEVARMTPLRPPERHPFSSGAISGPSVAFFNDHYQNLASRTPFYAPHAFLNPPHYMRNFSPSQQIQGFSQALDSISSDFSRTPSGLPATFMRPIRPPMRPSVDVTRNLQEKSTSVDMRNQGEFTGNCTLSSRPLEFVAAQVTPTNSLKTPAKEHQNEPSSKKRFTQGTAFSTPIVKPASSPVLKVSQQQFSPTPTSIGEASANVSAESLESAQDSSSSFHPHFRKGSLVMVGECVVKQVEDLLTSDFLEASKSTPGLVLDPSTVGAIAINTELNIATITFRFSSRNKEISVDASDDHPFFVFYKGWSSCNPDRTMEKYELPVRKLAIEDVCVSLQRKLCDEKTTLEAAAVMPPPKALPKTIHSVSATSTTVMVSSQLYGKSSLTSTLGHSPSSTAQCVSEASSSATSSLSVQTTCPSTVPVVGDVLIEKSHNSASVATWRRPSSTTYEKQKSSDDTQKNHSYSRKRRWSDPEH